MTPELPVFLANLVDLGYEVGVANGSLAVEQAALDAALALPSGPHAESVVAFHRRALKEAAKVKTVYSVSGYGLFTYVSLDDAGKGGDDSSFNELASLLNVAP